MLFRQFLVVYLMPFMYGTTTRVIFIYFGIHLMEHFKVGMVAIGFSVGAYQATRVCTNALAVHFPNAAILLGSAAGLLGNAIALIHGAEDLHIFLGCTIVVGAAETMSTMQCFCQKEYASKTVAVKQKMMKTQYASVMFGVMFGFCFGGILYQMWGIPGVVSLGTMVCFVEVASVWAYYLCAPRGNQCSEEEEPVERINTNDIPESAKIVGRNTLHHVRNLTAESASHTNTKELKPTMLLYVLAITMAMEAITIGFNLSVGPIFLLIEFGEPTQIIGILFAAGATAGTLTAVSMTLIPCITNRLEKWLPAPYNLYFSLTGIGVSVLVAAVPNLAVHVAGLICLMGFNDLCATLLIEVNGAISTQEQYRTISPITQVVRRCTNVMTALCGPFLYSWWPRGPHVVAGVFTLAWACLLVIVVETDRGSSARFMRAVFANQPSLLKAYMNLPWEMQRIIYARVESNILQGVDTHLDALENILAAVRDSMAIRGDAHADAVVNFRASVQSARSSEVTCLRPSIGSWNSQMASSLSITSDASNDLPNLMSTPSSGAKTIQAVGDTNISAGAHTEDHDHAESAHAAQVQRGRTVVV